MALRVRDIIDRAAKLAGIVAIGETLSGNEMSDANNIFNTLLDAMNVNSGLPYAQERLFPPITEGQRTYYFGEGQEWDYFPYGIESIEKINVSPNGIEYPVEIINYEQWSEIADKTLSGIPNKVFISKETGAQDLKFDFFPYPNTAMTAVIYANSSFLKPEDIDTTSGLDQRMYLPLGYEQYIIYSLTVQLCLINGRQINPIILEEKDKLEKQLKRSNLSVPLMKSDLLNKKRRTTILEG